jgi:thiamine biosynthesis lipoprotein
MVMDIEDTKKLLLSRKELYVLLIYTDENNQIQQYKTDNFKELLID